MPVPCPHLHPQTPNLARCWRGVRVLSRVPGECSALIPATVQDAAPQHPWAPWAGHGYPCLK